MASIGSVKCETARLGCTLNDFLLLAFNFVGRHFDTFFENRPYRTKYESASTNNSRELPNAVISGKNSNTIGLAVAPPFLMIKKVTLILNTQKMMF